MYCCLWLLTLCIYVYVHLLLLLYCYLWLLTLSNSAILLSDCSHFLILLYIVLLFVTLNSLYLYRCICFRSRTPVRALKHNLQKIVTDLAWQWVFYVKLRILTFQCVDMSLLNKNLPESIKWQFCVSSALCIIMFVFKTNGPILT